MSNQLKTTINFFIRKLNFSLLIILISLIVLPKYIFSAGGGKYTGNTAQLIFDDMFEPVDAVILWNSASTGADSIDQQSFQNALGSIGFTPIKINIEELRKTELNNNMLIILPQSSLSFLKEKDIDRILSTVNSGARVITDGNSKLLQQLKIDLSAPTQVKYVQDLLLHSPLLNWGDAPSVPLILNVTDKSCRVLYADSISGNAIGLIKTIGEGEILILSTMFDPISGEGYSRFPNLTNEIITELDCRPLFKRHGIDAYFDPGYRWDFPIKKLISIWKRWGIKAIHAAVWDMYTSPSYNFSLLVSEAHKQGILVYAWLEWPYVGTGFWNDHPEWRQKNALLKDAQLDFLSLMDLQNPNCMKRALNDLVNLLKDDWDGVDIAEFSITGGVSEALEGPDQPKYFTGFNNEARKEFKSLNGFDQIELFKKSSEHYWEKDSIGLDKFYKYRVLVNNRLLRQIVSSLDSVRTSDKRDWEFIFTVLDNSLHPEFDQLLGFDLPNTLKLAKQYHATLQVEDPASEWTRPPSRYTQLANAYTGLVGNIPFAIDINFVPVHPAGQIGFASEQPTGTELFQQFRAADNACSRVCFYAESSVYPYDWEVLPYAMAWGASIIKDKNQWRIQTPHTAFLNNKINGERIFLDGKPWYCYGPDGIIIPKGKHILTLGKNNEVPENPDSILRLTGINDELISCSKSGKGIEVIYQSPARCLITLNRLPNYINVDGKPTALTIMKENENYIIFAPSGKHSLLLFQ